MKKKRLFGLAALILVLAGCDGTLPYTSTNTSYNNTVKQSSESASDYYSESQHVSYDAYGTLETKNYDKDAESVMKLITDNGGMIQSQDSNHATNYYTDFVGTELSVVAKIPKGNFETVVQALKENYHVQSFNISSRDVTDDIENTGEALEVKKSRLDEINKKLEDDNLRFSEREELEADKIVLEDEIRALEEQQTQQTESVDFSTLTLSLREVDYFTSEGLPFWLPFARVFKSFFFILAWGLLIGLVVALSITPFIFVASLAYLLIRKHQYKMFHKLKNKMGLDQAFNSKEGSVKVDRNNNILLDGEQSTVEKPKE